MGNIKIPIHRRELEPRKKSLLKWRIPEGEQRALLRFMDELELGRVNKGRRISPARQLKYLDVLRCPLEAFGKPATRLAVKDVEGFEKALGSGALQSVKGRSYAQATKVDMRRALKAYLRWRLGDVRARQLTDWLDTRDVVKTPDYLKEAEVLKLYKQCKSAEERFLIAVLFDSGARAEEFHNIRYEDVHLPGEKENFVKLTLKEEYSKTKGRVISLYWKQSLEAVIDFIRERERQAIRSDEPVYTKSYPATRKFLQRLGRKVLDRSIHYHLFRHSSATYYAAKLSNRQQLCKRYGWTFSSSMPDTYIARSGVDDAELDAQFTTTALGQLKDEIARVQQQAQVKEDRIKELERLMAMIQRHLPLISEIVQGRPTTQEVVRALQRKRAPTGAGSGFAGVAAR